jgi:hypothetical protein
MSGRGRRKGEYRSAKREGTAVTPTGRREGDTPRTNRAAPKAVQ